MVTTKTTMRIAKSTAGATDFETGMNGRAILSSPREPIPKLKSRVEVFMAVWKRSVLGQTGSLHFGKILRFLAQGFVIDFKDSVDHNFNATLS